MKFEQNWLRISGKKSFENVNGRMDARMDGRTDEK